jgi:hypothetical protein
MNCLIVLNTAKIGFYEGVIDYLTPILAYPQYSLSMFIANSHHIALTAIDNFQIMEINLPGERRGSPSLYMGAALKVLTEQIFSVHDMPDTIRILLKSSALIFIVLCDKINLIGFLLMY